MYLVKWDKQTVNLPLGGKWNMPPGSLETQTRIEAEREVLKLKQKVGNEFTCQIVEVPEPPQLGARRGYL